MSQNGIGTKPRIASGARVMVTSKSRGGSIAHIHSAQNQTVGGVDPAGAPAAVIADIVAAAVAPVVAPAAVTPAATAVTPTSRGGRRRKGSRADGDGCSESKHSLTDHWCRLLYWTWLFASSCRLGGCRPANGSIAELLQIQPRARGNRFTLG